MKRLRPKIIKKIFGFLLVIGCGNLFLNSYVGQYEVYAQNSPSQAVVSEVTPAQTPPTNDSHTETNINNMGLREILNLILKIIYLLLWPLLVVAGISLDNTMVYASIFHMDAPLRKFWNMMKNFANFTLGFMVLFAIIKSLLTGSGEGSFKDEKSPLGIIKKTLIAGVLIQASRFLMAALVDLSTIATYAVGGLPLSVLKNTDIGNQKILSVNSQIDLNKFDVLNKDNTYFKVRYSTTYNGQHIKMSPCLVKQSFVIGREFGAPEYRNTDKFENDPLYKGYEVCVLFGNQLVMRKEDEFMEKIATNIGINPVPDWKTDASAYKTMINALLNYSGRDTKSWVTGSLVNLKEGTGGLLTGNMFFDQTISTTIAELIDKSKGFVGPLVTMYASLLNFAQLADTNVTTLGETSGIFLIKSGIAIALFFPLLALAVVLIARIALLWLFIVGSPFIIIKESFKDFLKLGKLDEYLNLKSVLGIIFAPVITVAALSISLIFMTALINGFKGGSSSHISENTMNTLHVQPIKTNTNTSSFRIFDTFEFQFENFDRGGTLDRFSRLIVNFFAIGLLRTILFAAIKANALGKTIGANIQTFGSNIFQTLPILPFGAQGEKVGLGPATQVLAARPAERVSERKAEQTGKIKALFEEPYKAPKFTTEQATTILNQMRTGNTIDQAYAAAGVRMPQTPTQAQTSTNLEAMFQAIQTLQESERLSAAATVAPIFGLTGSEWYTRILNQKADAAKTTIDTYIQEKKPKDKTAIENAFKDATGQNKEAIEQYFSSGNRQYEVATEDGNTYIVTRTSDGNTPPNYTYTANEKTQ